MQFPKELQDQDLSDLHGREPTSMKCSPRRNCDRGLGADHPTVARASMKCSSRRNCDVAMPTLYLDTETPQ